MPRDSNYPLLLAIVLGSLVLVPVGDSERQIAAQRTLNEATIVETLISHARGSDELMCELALHAIDGRYGNWGDSRWKAPDASRDLEDILRWPRTEISSPSTVQTLADALSDEDACASRVAARLFRFVVYDGAMEALVELASNHTEKTRQMATVALGYLEDDASVGRLIEICGDEAVSVRAAAAWALGEIEDERAIPVLVSLLREDNSSVVRRQAAWALGSMY